ncbi:Uncharacterised protein [Corynebacterium pseudotuberculosis]|nr:Uncharacterised protein [Corynebacterium pseudotuberculosis]
MLPTPARRIAATIIQITEAPVLARIPLPVFLFGFGVAVDCGVVGGAI